MHSAYIYLCGEWVGLEPSLQLCILAPVSELIYTFSECLLSYFICPNPSSFFTQIERVHGVSTNQTSACIISAY